MFALTDNRYLNDDTEGFGNFTHHFIEPENVKVAEDFMTDINNLEKVFVQNHRTYPIPYDYTLPENVKARVDI